MMAHVMESEAGILDLAGTIEHGSPHAIKSEAHSLKPAAIKSEAQSPKPKPGESSPKPEVQCNRVWISGTRPALQGHCSTYNVY